MITIKTMLATMIVIISSLAFMPPAFAAGGCPQTANSLDDFKGCLAPAPGGAVSRYATRYAAHLDDDHRQLLQAMDRDSGVPPQPMPSTADIVTPAFFPLMNSIAAYYAFRGNPGVWNFWALHYFYGPRY